MRGDDAEQKGNNDGHARGDRQHGRIDRRGVEAWHIGRSERDNRADTEEGEPDADCAGGCREHRTFGDEESQQRRAACSKRPANGHFVRARVAAGEQQVGNVDAGDDQHERDGGEQDVQRGPYRTEDHRVSDSTFVPRAALSGKLFSRSAAMAPISACAAPIVAVGASRPIISKG